MRILYLNPTGRLGGAESSLLDVLASLRSAAPDWTLRVIAASDGAFVERTRALGIPVDLLPFPPSLARVGEHGAGALRLVADVGRASAATLRYRTALARAIAAYAPDVIHTNGLKMHVLGAWAAERLPLVWHLHDYLGPRRATTTLLKWNHARCATIVANSASVAADAARALANGTPIVTVPNGVDLRRFSADGERLDLDATSALPTAPADTVRVGLVATFARWKGHRTFLEALAKLASERPDLPVRGYIVGDAVYQTDGSQHSIDELRRTAYALGVGDRVGFTGFVSGVETAFRALDIVVHASTLPEPFGLVVAEAMACARPVVVSAAGGAAELVTPGIDALVHAPGDAQDLASQVARLAADRDLRARLGRAARATAERSFDRARLAGELMPIYTQAARM